MAYSCNASEPATMGMCEPIELLYVSTDPGPNLSRKGFDVFLETLIEELKELWKGVNTFHVPHHDNKKGFTLRTTVFLVDT